MELLNTIIPVSAKDGECGNLEVFSEMSLIPGPVSVVLLQVPLSNFRYDAG